MNPRDLPPLPNQATLAIIAAGLSSRQDARGKVLAALELWHAAGEALVPLMKERRRAEARHWKEVERLNAANRAIIKQEQERAKDPFGLTGKADRGMIPLEDFLIAILPQKVKGAQNVRKGQPKRKAWRKEKRDDAFRRYITGNEVGFRQIGPAVPLPDGKINEEELTEHLAVVLEGQEEVVSPRFPDGKKRLNRYTREGIPLADALAIAEDFDTWARADRELANLSAKMSAARESAKARGTGSTPPAKPVKKPRRNAPECPHCGVKMKGETCDCAFEKG